jgi:hypothetical protein
MFKPNNAFIAATQVFFVFNATCSNTSSISYQISDKRYHKFVSSTPFLDRE